MSQGGERPIEPTWNLCRIAAGEKRKAAAQALRSTFNAHRRTFRTDFPIPSAHYKEILLSLVAASRPSAYITAISPTTLELEFRRCAVSFSVPRTYPLLRIAITS